MSKKIIICGDIHGKWGYLNTLINKRHPNIIFQCGDFCWFPKFHREPEKMYIGSNRTKEWNQYGIKPQNTEIFWCDGNHEDISDLNLQTTTDFMGKNIHYMKRGSILELKDGRIVLFMGGALSTDKDSRTQGIDYFPEEILTIGEAYKLNLKKVDIVISHTCPNEFRKELVLKYNGYDVHDGSQDTLSVILDMFKPSLWYFGHFHIAQKGIYKNTKWQCMHMAPFENWWVYLDK